MKDKKTEIADCFEKHFTHYGFNKTSVDDVVRELGISKKTIYQFFTTKEEIFYFIVRRVAGQYCASMGKKLNGAGGAKNKVKKLVSMIFAESRKWLKSNDAFEFRYKHDIASLAFKDAYAELFLQLVNEGIGIGEFHIKSPQTGIAFMQGIISEAQKILSDNPDSKIEEETIESILKILS